MESITIKYGSLVILILQIVVNTVVMRYSRLSEGEMYFATVVVFLVEILKVLVCLVITLVMEKSISGWRCQLRKHFIVEYKTFLKLAIPASAFALLNNLHYLALSNLEIATYQVTYQLKILTTAFFSVIILKRQLSKLQWLSMFILFAGVSVIHLDHTKRKDDVNHNLPVGLLAVITGALCSGFGGVYFEKILKSTESVSVWMRNIQMGTFTALFALIGMIINDGASIRGKGLFNGFNGIVIFLVVWNVFGNLVVAVVMKYADNVLKVFATSVSIILACVFSILFMEFKVTAEFLVGSSFVVTATWMFSRNHVKDANNNWLCLLITLFIRNLNEAYVTVLLPYC